MKNTILFTLGVGDFFFSKENSKIEGQEVFVKLISQTVTNKKYTGVVNVTIPSDTNKNVNVFGNLRPQRVSKLTLFSDNLIHVNNELKLLSHDNEDLLFDGNQVDFIFPPQDYEIHICGLDVNGVFNTGITELLNLGYKVTLYSDCIKPFKNTYKNINKLLKNPNFTYCSRKAAI